MHKIFIILLVSSLVISCGESSDLEKKKSQLQEKQKELAELKADISMLEEEINQIDPDFQQEEPEVLVASLKVEESTFQHQIEVRGSVTSRKNVMISAETMGLIEKVLVREGDMVKKGDLLLKLDDDVIRNNIEEIKTQLELATTVFERQKNLWDQNIGTEIQYLQARNNMQSLERRLQTLQSQLRQYYVKAPFTGNVDAVPVRVGEMAQPGVPLIRIVNPNEMYIKADVSEAYLGKFQKGDEVTVQFPIKKITFKSTINSVSKVINMENRTFTVEIGLPESGDFEYQPNQVVVTRMTDYKNDSALAVPTKLIQTDNKGKYVFAIKSEEGINKAIKMRVETGMTFNGQTEITDGLQAGILVVEQGYRDVNDGTEVKLASR